MMRRAGVVLSTALLLGGCAHYAAAPISPAHNAAALERRSLNDPRLHRFIAAELGSPNPTAPWDLARLTLAAVFFHPDLDIAQARLAQARAAITTARQHPNPRLDLTTLVGTAAVAGTIPAGAAPLTIGPVVNLLIETAGKREARTARARHLAAAARADIATAAWRVRARVRGALLDLWAAEHRLTLLRRRLDLQAELTRLLESRLAAGAASALELSREHIRQDEAALAVREEERARADARARLAAAIGIPLSALDGAPLSLAAFDHPERAPSGVDAATLRRQALTGRSDVAAALAAYKAADSAVRLAVAGQVPNLTLGPGYQYDFGVNKYVLGPSLTLPIFNRHEGQIAEALAARQAAAAHFTALQEGVIAAIDRAVTNLRATRATLATARALAAAARRREHDVLGALAAGQSDRPALLAAGLAATEAALSRLDARIKERRALGRLEDALHHELFDPAAPLPAPATSPRRPPRATPGVGSRGVGT